MWAIATDNTLEIWHLSTRFGPNWHKWNRFDFILYGRSLERLCCIEMNGTLVHFTSAIPILCTLLAPLHPWILHYCIFWNTSSSVYQCFANVSVCFKFMAKYQRGLHHRHLVLCCILILFSVFICTYVNWTFWKFIWLSYNVLVFILLLRFLLMSKNVIPAQPGSRLQNIVGQIWSLHAQLFNTEMPGVAEPPHYVGRTWHMAVFSRAPGQGTTDGKGRTVTGS